MRVELRSTPTNLGLPYGGGHFSCLEIMKNEKSITGSNCMAATPGPNLKRKEPACCVDDGRPAATTQYDGSRGVVSLHRSQEVM